MNKKLLLSAYLFTLLSSLLNAQESSSSGEIISYQKFGEGLMVTKAKMVPISGIVTNIFFYNREDEPWNGNVWYEYDFEIRGKNPKNAWSQIRVRPEDGADLKDAPIDISITENLGDILYHYILIRKDDVYVYDIRLDFDINTYDYNNASAHGNNSVSLVEGGPRVYSTGGAVDDIPSWKQLDFSLGATAFDTSWGGFLPDGSYSGDFVVDYTRFYQYSGNNLNTSPQWQDEFNGSSIDYSKWQIATWTFRDTQFKNENIRVEDGYLIITANRDENNAGNSNTNLALNGTASQSSTGYNGSASRAIDNNTNGNWNNNSVTHTNNETNAWWEVELRQESKLNQIVIYNRVNCCTDRLSDFSVSVLDENDAVVWTQFYTDTPSPSLTINLDATGNKVRVNQNGTLSLAEVQVYGELTSEPEDDIVTFYQHYNYGGYQVHLDEGEYRDVSSEGIPLNDASSIAIQNGYTVELYSELNFGGTKVTLTSDNSRFGSISFNDMLASVKIYPTITSISARAAVSSSKTMLYPNPASEYVNIYSNEGIAVQKLHIYDNAGRAIETHDINYQLIQNNEFSIRTNHLESGIYTIKLDFVDGTFESHNLIIKHE